MGRFTTNPSTSRVARTMILRWSAIALLIALGGCGDGRDSRTGDPDRSFGSEGAVTIGFWPESR